MNVWIKFADEVIIVAPFELSVKSVIDIHYKHSNIKAIKIPSINFQNSIRIICSLINLPLIFIKIFQEMRSADHIHLRCPGNIGLIGCFVQILFPSKLKSAKYAGNWDPNSKQPLSYKLQKWILTNTFLTKNIQVLVYGEWPNQTKNIKAFFTATYSESDKLVLPQKKLEGKIRFLFVGALSEGKRPFYALKLVEALSRNGIDVQIDFYGEGVERKVLQNYIKINQLDRVSILHGNQTEDIVKNAYKNSHFVVLPSKSEGWPKAIAEAMFWGVVPIASSVSCVPEMLNFGERGYLLTMNLSSDCSHISDFIDDGKQFEIMSIKAQQWSRNFTLDLFESKIIAITKAQ